MKYLKKHRPTLTCFKGLTKNGNMPKQKFLKNLTSILLFKNILTVVLQ